MTISLGSIKSEINDRLANTSISALETCQLENANNIIMNVPVKKIDGALPSDCTGLMVYCDGPTKAYYYSKGTSWASDTNSKGTESYPLYGASSCGNICGVLGLNDFLTSFMALQKIGTDDQWTEISSGADHSLALKKDGSLWGWGWNIVGQVGDNTTNNTKFVPSREALQSNEWCTISAGWYVSSAIKTDGSLWTWGCASCGTLGNNCTITNFSTPTRESTSSNNWCAVSVGLCHSAAIKKDGSLWAWGRNASGEIGDNSITPRFAPTREITGSNNWCAIAAGGQATHAIKTDGTLWSWGLGTCGLLGDNTIVSKSSPVQEVSLSTNWTSVASNYGTAAHAIKKDGSLWSWGYNTAGQLGSGDSISRSSPVRESTSSNNWAKVVSGFNSAFGLKQDGTLWGWGCNANGQLLLGQKYYATYTTPTQEYTKSNNWITMALGRANYIAGHAIKKVVQGYCV